MQASQAWTDWLKHWLYDWDGANVSLFLTLNHALPEGLLWLPAALTWLGSYWGAPFVVALLLAWRRLQPPKATRQLDSAICTFVIGLVLALSAAALAKVLFALPRPLDLLGESAFRVVGTPDSRYTLPSGHSTYVAVLAAAVWPILAWPGRVALVVFAATVGWSRIALGAHFPADVVASFVLGAACVAAAVPLARRMAPKLSLLGAVS